MRIAVTGAYGAGKTTLTTSFSELTGVPRTHGTPMRDPDGDRGATLATANAPELIRLVVRRLTERAVDEHALSAGFISDGSVLHEWVYATLRLDVGTHPSLGTVPRRLARAGAPSRTEPTDPYGEVLDELGVLVEQHALASYDHFVHLPTEFPLSVSPPPISERFRTLSDEMLLEKLSSWGIPVHVVRGDHEHRFARLLGLTGLRPVGRVGEPMVCPPGSSARSDGTADGASGRQREPPTDG